MPAPMSAMLAPMTGNAASPTESVTTSAVLAMDAPSMPAPMAVSVTGAVRLHVAVDDALNVGCDTDVDHEQAERAARPIAAMTLTGRSSHSGVGPRPVL